MPNFVCWRKTPILAIFGLRHLVLSPIGSSLRKLNTGAQLQIFRNQRNQNRFCTPPFAAKSGAKSLTFKSVTNTQTDRQTNKQAKKLNVFGHPGGG